MLRALFPQAAFMPTQRSIYADVQLHSRRLHSNTRALVDSGATDNFISPTLLQTSNIKAYKLSKPRTIRNVDGTKNNNGATRSAVLLTIRYNGQDTKQKFYVADLGEDWMILGMPFLAAANPDIDWSTGTFDGEIMAATQDAHLWTPLARSKRPEVHLRSIPEGTLPGQTYYEHEVGEFLNIEPKDYAFISHHKQEAPSNETAEGEPIIRRISHATNLAASAADKTERTWQEQVPLEYHQFGKVFSDEEAQRFPNSRPWDHEIELTPDAPQVLNCKVYPLAEGQQELLDQFLDEHLKKGYIRVSNSPYASPFFFVKKNDGKQRPVQDYRQLNNHTVRNTYPLPLIKELVTQLIKKQWFTKFDVRWGYNNIRIKDGDQWKAAFKTNRGLFEPTVMFFGLTNSLATFQTMMDATFCNEIATGDVVIYMDDILIATAGSLD